MSNPAPRHSTRSGRRGPARRHSGSRGTLRGRQAAVSNAPERLEERRVLTAAVLGDPEILAASLVVPELGHEALSVWPSSAFSYNDVDARWFWAAEAPVIPSTAAVLSSAASEEWIVRLTNQAISSLSATADLESFLDPAGLGLRVMAGLGLPGLVLVGTPIEGVDVSAHLAEHAGVAYFEPNDVFAANFSLPNDSRFGELYGLHNVGQSGGLVDADIDAPEAWQFTTGSRNVVVAVIDTGIDMAHRDLYRNVWINQAEIPPALRSALADVDGDGRITFVDLNHPANTGFVTDRNGNGYIDALDLLADSRWVNGHDTDGNSFIDDLFGWNFVSNTNNPSDDNRHGTHVAGTIGATGNDGVGVAGVSWEVSMMGIKFLSGSGGGSTANAVKSVNYATMMRLRGDEGIRVTNNSWGGGGYSQALKDAIDAGGAADILFVAAAGNSRADVDRSPQYPAGYASPAIVAVAATDRYDALASFSNFGASRVHLGAPGTGILSAVPGGGYASLSGTSMAAPHIAGAAALALAANPSLSLTELKEAILATTDPVPALTGRTLTGGRLNAAQLVEMVGVPAAEIELSASSVPENAPPGTVIGTLTATARMAEGFLFSLVPGAADNALFTIDGNLLRTVAVFDFETRSSYTIRVRAVDTEGVSTEKTFAIAVTDQPEAPRAVILSGSRVRREAPAGTIVGSLRADDPDAGDTSAYTLVSGDGDTDNALFVIVGDSLRTSAPLDFSTRAGFEVRIRATDSTGFSVDGRFRITEATVDRYGFDTLIIEAFQAGSMLDLDDLRVVNLATGEVVYNNDFNAGASDGLTLTHWPDRHIEPRFDPTMTRIMNGRMRLESTGYGRNGAGGYDSKSRATLSVQLPENFELSFTLYKHQWAGHVHIHIAPESLGMPYWLPQTLDGLGGFATNIQGGQINFANLLGTDGTTLNLLDPPGSGTTGPFLQTDVKYRIVKQQGTFSLYVQDRLRAHTESLTPLMPEPGAPTDVVLTGSAVPENAPPGTLVGRLTTVDPDADDTFTYSLVPGAGDAGNPLFVVDGDILRTATPLDFEAGSSHSIRIRSTDKTGLTVEKVFTIDVLDVNEPPSRVEIGGRLLSIPESADTSRPIRVGVIVITDDALGHNEIALSGPDAHAFEVASGVLFLKAGIVLDHEAAPSLAVTVTVTDPTLDGSSPVSVEYLLAVTPAVTSWSYGFRHVNEPGADGHLIENFGMRKYSEWQSTPITYWGPTTNGLEGRLVYRFDFPQAVVGARMRLSLPSWDYTRPPDSNYSGSGRGAWALEVSRDGESWVAVRNNLEPRNWGEKWSMDGLLPTEVLGGQTLFVRMRFLVENSPNSSYTNSQFGRSTAAATSNVFEITASLAANRRPADILLSGGGIPEDAPIGMVVGGLTTIDPDPDDTFTYTLVSGDGDADNAAFRIVGDTLVTAAGFDYETQDTLSVRIRSTDTGGRWVERMFTLQVIDVNEPPTAVQLENVVTTLREDSDTSAPVKLAGIVVSDDALGTNRITLAGPDAKLFLVVEGSLYLRAGVKLDHSAAPELRILIVVLDPDLPDTDPVTAAYTLQVGKVDRPVPRIVLSSSDVDENLPIGTPVGTFSRKEERSELTPLHLFYSPQDGQMRLSNTTTESLAVQSVTITSPGQKLNGAEAQMPDAPFRTTNHDETAPFGRYSEIFFASFGTAALTLDPGGFWDFGFVADVGFDRQALDNHFQTDPEVDDGAGDRFGRFLYTLLDTDAVAAWIRGRITSTASEYTFELVAGAGDADNGFFTVDGQTLLTAAEFDYEARDTYSIRIRSTGPSALTVEEIVTITIRDVNEAPAAIRLIDAVASLPEDIDTNLPIPLGTIVVEDDALGMNVVTLHGDDAGLFMIEDATLFLRVGAALDFETRDSFSLTLRVRDVSLPDASVATDYVLTIIDVNEPPRAVELANLTDALPEQLFGPAGERIHLADIVITDDALGANEITLEGPDAAVFEVVGTRLYLRAGVELDYETQDAYDVTILVADPSLDGSEPVAVGYRLRVVDLNESPTAILLTNRLLSLPESADTSERIRVADITVVDDALGSNGISLSGRDASLFEVVGDGLYLRAGVTLDYGLRNRFQVALHVADETALDRLAETPLTLVYEAATGRMQLVNTMAGQLAIQSVGIVSPFRVLSGREAEIPEAVFTVLNTSARGLFGEHSEIFFANVGAAVLSLKSGEVWDLGPVAVPGLTAAALQGVFSTDPEADPEFVAGPGRFLYSLPDGDAARLVRGAIVTDVQVGFTLGIVNVPEHSGREYIEVAAGETVIDTIRRTGDRQVIKRGEGTLVLAAANAHAGGTRVEGGMIVARDSNAAGLGTLELLAGTSAIVDIGTGRMSLGGLQIDPAARIDVGFGGLRLAGNAVDPAILRQWLITGRSKGDWRGNGIGSSEVAGQRGRAVGYRILADGSATVAWAAVGDANLDGRVNSTDINMILSGGRFGRPGNDAGWWQGDFNYDGRVNSQDLNQLMAAGLLNAPSYHAEATPSRGIGIMIVKPSQHTIDLRLAQPATAVPLVTVVSRVTEHTTLSVPRVEHLHAVNITTPIRFSLHPLTSPEK